MVNVFAKWMMTFQRKIFVFKDILECSITYKLSEDHLKFEKRKWFNVVKDERINYTRK